jgi:hypothetical protein
MLSAFTLSNLIEDNLATNYNANGYNLQKFCNAVATGIVMSIAGKSFTTSDVGTVPGTGTGSGTGIAGLSSATMQNMALYLMISQGPNAGLLMKAIMDSVVTHLESATLTSSDTPVYLGTGTVVVGSIGVNASEMSNNITNQFVAQGAMGPNYPNLSDAIGTAIVNNILNAGTGTLSITGSPSGPTSPGTGSGSGTIS